MIGLSFLSDTNTDTTDIQDRFIFFSETQIQIQSVFTIFIRCQFSSV
jgi:hypothetical protein